MNLDSTAKDAKVYAKVAKGELLKIFCVLGEILCALCGKTFT